MNQSAQLFSRARAVIPGGVNSPVRAFRNVDGDPFFVQSAKGAYITDADGRQLIDYIGTWGPAILGHAPQTVLNAVHAAVDRGLGYGIPAPAEVDMAEMITGMVPSVEKCAWSTPERKRPCPPSGWRAATPDAAKSSNSSAATTAMWTPCWWRRAPGRSPSENRTAQAYPGK